MQFETLKDEKEFDHYCSEWLHRYRFPGKEALTLVMQRAYDNMGDGLPSIAHFERAYRELYSEGRLLLITEPIKVEAVAQPEVLTADSYKKLSASFVTRKYLVDRNFKAQVDRLIARKEI
jgi:hypothetical protein